jgi:hypothetical protein
MYTVVGSYLPIGKTFGTGRLFKLFDIKTFIVMRNRILIVVIGLCAGLFVACNGDHSTRVVRDTVKNRYGADTAKISKSNRDTGKVTSATGDASSLDNSGSGGTKISKDSTKKSPPKK